MAYNYEFPYADIGRVNADWLLNKVKELESAIVGIEEGILAKAKEYIDIEIAPFQRQLDDLRDELGVFESKLEGENELFKTEVRAQIAVFDARITLIRAQLENEIILVNARTDVAIQQNNEYLFEELSKGFSELRVTNFFTGERVSIQDMLDYLSSLHVDDGLTYNQIASRHNTVNQIIAIHSTITNLVLHANSLITQQ